MVVEDAGRLLADDLVDLVRQRFARHGHDTPREAVVDRLRRAQRLPGMTVLVAYRHGRACAFKAFAVDSALGRIVSRFGGCAPNDFFAYFNVAFYEPLRYGPERGLHTMTLGTETYAAKLARGAVLHTNQAFVRALDPSLDAALHRACVLRTGAERRRIGQAAEP